MAELRFEVELAALEDLPAIAALDRETPDAPHWGEEAYRAALSEGEGGLRRCLFVAKRAAEVIGFAVGSAVAGTAELESVGVQYTARRQGVGGALCREVMEWACGQGAAAMQLEVRAGSAGARALYAELGFVECGRRPNYYGDPMDDAVLMRLDCG